MSFNDEFQREPVEFLHKYAIITTEERINNPTGKKVKTARFSFAETPWEVGGMAQKVLALSPDDGGFPAYWLSYEDNKSKRAVLGTAARFMFTANMDGCSFGFGSKTDTGEVLVAHANAATVGEEAKDTLPDLYEARKVQAIRQHEMLMKKMQPGALSVLHPHAYADPFFDPDGRSNPKKIYKYGATVVGILEDSGWDFYCQLRVITMSTQFILRGVEKLNGD